MEGDDHHHHPSSASDPQATGGFSTDLTAVARADREAVARVRNCVLALASNGVMLWDTTLSHAFEASGRYGFSTISHISHI